MFDALNASEAAFNMLLSLLFSEELFLIQKVHYYDRFRQISENFL